MFTRLTLTLTVLALSATLTLAQTPTTQRALEPAESETPAANSGKAPTVTSAPAEGPTTQPVDPKKTPSFWDQYSFPIILGAGIVLLFVMNSRSRKKQEQKRRDLLAALKKGDKITTIGGVIGTIVDVREDEVVVKIDDANNTKMRFARWAIRDTGKPAANDTGEEKK